jgi:hypothetical protein
MTLQKNAAMPIQHMHKKRSSLLSYCTRILTDEAEAQED